MASLVPAEIWSESFESGEVHEQMWKTTTEELAKNQPLF